MCGLKKYLFVYVAIFFIVSCSENNSHETALINAEENVKDIHEVETNLPGGQGEELIKTHCLTCHSLRYIQMQPAFPRKTWEKIVGKMIKSFGAPIPDSSAKEIVNYLVAVKGKTE